MEIFVTEFGFEDLRFAAGTRDLHGDENEEDTESERLIDEEKNAGDGETAEEVDGIANARIEAARYERVGLRADGEGGAELDAGEDEKRERGQADYRTGDSQRSPRIVVVMKYHENDGQQTDDECADVSFHVLLVRAR